MNWKFGCLAMFVLIIGAPVIASRYLHWWETLLFIIAEGALLRWGLPRLLAFGIKRAAMGMFETKSRVLRGAMCEVHRVELTTAPVRVRELPNESHHEDESDDERDEDDEPDGDEDFDDHVDEEDEDDAPIPGGRYVLIEFTITPKPGQSRMSLYEPSEILLIPFDRKIKIDEQPSSAESGALRQIRLVDESGQETDDFDKLPGRARFRAIFACPPTFTGRAKLQYYFESFGDVMLP
jgi:hypothetical protein